MTRKVTNRRVGPKNKENPTGKHKSLLQDVTYSESIDHPMKEAERVRMSNEFARMGAITKPFDLPTMLEKYRTIAITYLDDSGIEYKECDGWEWGRTLTDEYKAAAKRNGGFVAAFKVLNTARQVENKLKRGDTNKAIAYSLHLGLYTRQIVKAEMEALYHAGVKQTEAANHDKSQAVVRHKETAKPIFESHLVKGKSRTRAAELTAIYLKEEHGISKAPHTIRGWFKSP